MRSESSGVARRPRGSGVRAALAALGTLMMVAVGGFGLWAQQRPQPVVVSLALVSAGLLAVVGVLQLSRRARDKVTFVLAFPAGVGAAVLATSGLTSGVPRFLALGVGAVGLAISLMAALADVERSRQTPVNRL